MKKLYSQIRIWEENDTNPAPILDPMAMYWPKMFLNCLTQIELYLRNVTKPHSDILIDI